MNNAKNVHKFSILLPVNRSPIFLPYAIKSVLGQTEIDFELFIICDGSPAATVTCANAFAKADSRIKVLAFEKGQRSGEAHRHTALKQATGEFVAHIQDDDLWLPHHLSELEKLLQEFDFGNLLHVFFDTKKQLDFYPGDLGDVSISSRMLNSPFNIFGLSVAGYRLRAYHSLSQGWSPAPEDVWPDLHMWRKFLSKEGLQFGSRVAITVLKFPAHIRSRQEEDIDLITEIKKWYNEIQLLATCDHISQEILKKMSQRAFDYSQQLINVNNEFLTLQKENTTILVELEHARDEIAAKNNELVLAESVLAREKLKTTQLLIEIQTIFNTRSWKITALFRIVKAKLIAINGALKRVLIKI